jgi:hypothetical protein
MAVTGIGRVKAAMENDLNKAFTSSEKGLGQFNASVANMLNDASPIAEALGHILGKVASMTSGAVDHVDEWSRKLSALILEHQRGMTTCQTVKRNWLILLNSSLSGLLVYWYW